MRVEFDGMQRVIKVNNVQISLDVLEAITRPDPDKLIRFVREGDVVTVTEYLVEQLPDGQ